MWFEAIDQGCVENFETCKHAYLFTNINKHIMAIFPKDGDNKEN